MLLENLSSSSQNIISRNPLPFSPSAFHTRFGAGIWARRLLVLSHRGVSFAIHYVSTLTLLSFINIFLLLLCHSKHA
jgi:hypothetical protein